MKKILLLSSVICISIAASSQVVVPKGKKIVGGSFFVSTNHINADSTIGPPGLNDQNQYSFGISPSIGFAKKENSVFGFLLFTRYGKWEAQNASSNTVQEGSTFAAGPGVYYEKFYGLGKNFHFSAMGTLRATYGKQKYKEYDKIYVYSESEARVMATNLTLTPSLGYSINSKWMVQASVGEIVSIGYSRNKSTVKGSMMPERKTEYSSFHVSSRLNQGLQLGSLVMALRYTF